MSLPIELLKSGQLLRINLNSESGIILQKPYFAEFLGPGAAVGGMFDLQCVTIYTLGRAEFTVPETLGERQDAFRCRVENIEAMQDLCQSDAPLPRSVAFLEMLCERFGAEQIQSIPNDVLAKVVGVLPSTLTLAWQKQKKIQSPADQSEETDSLTYALA